MKRPLSEAELAQRRAAGRIGGATRAKQFTREYQQMARANVQRENLVTNGQKAAATCIERYGPHVHSRRLAFWRQGAPTKLIKIVTGWLDEAWIGYTTEVELVPGKIFADIVPHVHPRRIVIECDGAHWHENNEHVAEDREARDIERDAQIRALGYELLHLPEKKILDGSGRAELYAFLGLS